MSKLITIPNLVQTTNGFKDIQNVKVGDKVLSMGEWKDVLEPPVKTQCTRITLTSGFSITIEKTARQKKQASFQTSVLRKFSDRYNSGFYAIPHLTDSGFMRVPKGDSRLYNSLTCLTRQVWTPNGKLGFLKPIRINDEDYSLLSCLDALESIVNRGFYIDRKGNVFIKRTGEFGALILSLLKIDVYVNDSNWSLVAPYSLFRLFSMIKDVDIIVPNYIYEKAIRYNNNTTDGYYQTVSKEIVTDWCLRGLKPDINGVSMNIPSNRNYWCRLVNRTW